MVFVAGTAYGVLAKCGDNANDLQQVKDARTEVASTCNCTGSTNHGQFVKCAKTVAIGRTTTNPPQLSKQCKGAVIKCASHSTCGSTDKVTCCVTKNGKTSCKLTTSAKCAAKQGMVGGIGGLHTSCCSDTAPLTMNSCLASPNGAFLD
jgi:hypothetical protein